MNNVSKFFTNVALFDIKNSIFVKNVLIGTNDKNQQRISVKIV